ncbi:MAG TPA: TIGR04282 family arsenosugar biosynthesis glycosyltransferase [Dehalococcoidia bacterium]|nr:TIGR04282 family arsenosugar biosynthesis glycosyltransferase [Dehalococcoidia bacterium]
MAASEKTVDPARHVRLAILSRAPEPGRSKTRLAAAIGDAAAAHLAEAFLLDISEALRDSADWTTTLFVEPAAAADQMRRLTGIDEVQGQTTGSIGARMAAAVAASISAGADTVIVVGSDIPALGADHVRITLEALREHDVVFGPARDGGYYLVGIGPTPLASGRYIALFDDTAVQWSTATVLAESEAIAKEQRFMSARLGEASDVDTVADLASLRRELAALPITRAVHTRAALRALDGDGLI